MNGRPIGSEILSRLWRAAAWLDHGGLLVAAIATAHCAATGALLGFKPSGALLLLAASGTFLVYHLDRAVRVPDEDRVNRPARVAWIEENSAYRWLAPGIAAILAFIAAVQLPLLVLGGAVIVGAIGSLHGVPLLLGRRPKDYPTVKPFLIAAVWSAGAVVLPILEHYAVPAPLAVALLGIGRLLYVLANVMLCDLHDRPGDLSAPRLADRAVRHSALRIALAGAGAVVVGGLMTPWPGLWLFDAAGPILLAAAARAGNRQPLFRHPLVLDLLVGWPMLTVLLAAA